MKKISLIGSTGSIGRQVVEVVKNHPDEYKIVGVAAFGDRETFARQTELLKPEICALASEDFEKALSVAEYGDIVFNAAVFTVCERVIMMRPPRTSPSG